MQNITIGRYKPSGRELPEGVHDVCESYDGWIEGVRDDGSSWIMWLDAHGNPESFSARRDETGAVIGEPIDLTQ